MVPCERNSVSRRDTVTVVWRGMLRTFEQAQSDWALERVSWYHGDAVATPTCRCHRSAVAISDEQWGCIGEKREIHELPDWAVEQLFGMRCDNVSCQCVLLERKTYEEAHPGERGVSNTPVATT